MRKEPQEDISVWKSRQMEGISFFKATFKTFSFDRHTHEDYALGVIEEGVQSFRHKGADWTAPAGSVITVNPDEVHDGRALWESGYRYRMLYLTIVLAALVTYALLMFRTGNILLSSGSGIALVFMVRLIHP